MLAVSETSEVLNELEKDLVQQVSKVLEGQPLENGISVLMTLVARAVLQAPVEYQEDILRDILGIFDDLVTRVKIIKEDTVEH